MPSQPTQLDRQQCATCREVYIGEFLFESPVFRTLSGRNQYDEQKIARQTAPKSVSYNHDDLYGFCSCKQFINGLRSSILSKRNALSSVASRFKFKIPSDFRSVPHLRFSMHSRVRRFSLIWWLILWLVVWSFGGLVDWFFLWWIVWLVVWLIPWFIDWLVHWLVHWFIGVLFGAVVIDRIVPWIIRWGGEFFDPLIPCSSDGFLDLLIDRFLNSAMGSLIYWLIDWSIPWSSDAFFDSLIDSLIDPLILWCVLWLIDWVVPSFSDEFLD